MGSEGPTLEQLENVAVAFGFPILAEGLRPAYYEESLRNLHRIAQDAISGDEEASRKLATLQAAFGRRDAPKPVVEEENDDTQRA